MSDPTPFSTLMDTVGDQSGDIEFIGNYSSSPEEVIFAAQGGDVAAITRMIVLIEDLGNFDADGYGAGGALTNGITMEIRSSTDVVLAVFSMNVKKNAQWGGIAYDITYHSFGGGAANKFLLVRWTFKKSGVPIILRDGEKLVVKLNDDFSHLVDHTFTVQGHYRNRRI